MPVYWEGNKIVGTSGGTDTSGNPINPQGKVEGKDYGSGGSSGSGSSGSSGNVSVYDTKTGQYITVSQKIYDAIKSQGSMRYSESSSGSTYIGSSQQVDKSPQTARLYPPGIPQPQNHIPSIDELGQVPGSLVTMDPFTKKEIPVPLLTPSEWQASKPQRAAGKVYVPTESGGGWVTPQPPQEKKALLEVMPSGISLSGTSRGIFSEMQKAANVVRGASIDPFFAKSGDPFQTAALHVKESAARVLEFAGGIPATTEIFAKAAEKNPASVPAMLGMGALFTVGGIAKQAEKEPAQFVSDIAVSTVAFHSVKAGVGKTQEFVKFSGKEFVAPQKIMESKIISGDIEFPTARKGTTALQLVNEFKKSPFKLPGTEGKIGGWHATPIEFPKATKTFAGSSESPGLYIAPSTSPHFWKVSTGYKLFGWDAPPKTPTGLWVGVEDITRALPNARKMAAFNEFLSLKAPKGKAYISAAFETGGKLEKEAIISPNTELIRLSNKHFTEWKGKKIPLMEYSAKRPQSPFKLSNKVALNVPTNVKDIVTIQNSKGKPWVFGTTNKGLISLGGVAVMGLPVSAKQGKGKTQKTTTADKLLSKQSKEMSEYMSYRKPIFTPGSLLIPSVRRSVSKSRSQTTSNVYRQSKAGRQGNTISSISGLPGLTGSKVKVQGTGYPTLKYPKTGYPTIKVLGGGYPRIMGTGYLGRSYPQIPKIQPPRFEFSISPGKKKSKPSNLFKFMEITPVGELLDFTLKKTKKKKRK